jgi:hypothetical protein
MKPDGRREMKSFDHFVQAWSGKLCLHLRRYGFIPVAFLAVSLSHGNIAIAQAVPSADRGGATLWAGGTASGYYVGYGGQKLVGVTAFVDADTLRHIGIEGEARWLVFHQTNDVHVATYTGGLRYWREYGRFQPYVKGLAGLGQFNFPYNYATGNFLVVAPGGGLDYRLTHRIRLRAVDFEYQIWPQFTYGSMSAYGVSTGIRVRIF